MRDGKRAVAAGGGSTRPPKAVYRQQYGLIVICRSEADQQRLYKRLVRSGLKPRVVTT
jgi:hypothetical protein